MKNIVMRVAAELRIIVVLLLSQHGTSVVVGTIAGTAAVVGLCLFGDPDLPTVSSLLLNDSLVAVMLASAIFYIRHPDKLANSREIAEMQGRLAGSHQAQTLSRILAAQRGRALRSQLDRLYPRAVAP